jgi:hypothetical protein
MHNLPPLIQVKPFERRYSDGLSSPVIAGEEFEGVATGYDSGTLVV